NVAHADQHAILRRDFGRKIIDIRKICRAQAHHRSQWHAMDIAAGRTVWRVDVGVRINPDQANFLSALPVIFRHSRGRARANRMIAAQHDRHLAGFERFQYEIGFLGAGRANLFQILRVRIARLLLLSNRNRNVPRILDHVPKLFEACFEPRHSYRRGAHINATPRLTEVEWYSDDTEFLGGNSGGVADRTHSLFTAKRRRENHHGKKNLTGTTDAASSRTVSSLSRVPVRRPKPPLALRPCRSRHAARCRISADPDTT